MTFLISYHKQRESEDNEMTFLKAGRKKKTVKILYEQKIIFKI